MTLRNATARRILAETQTTKDLYWVSDNIAFASVDEASLCRDVLLTFHVPCRVMKFDSERAMLRLL